MEATTTRLLLQTNKLNDNAIFSEESSHTHKEVLGKIDDSKKISSIVLAFSIHTIAIIITIKITIILYGE